MKPLIRFLAKIPGVCNAKIGTILKAIHEEYDENGKSRSTFKRMVQKAIALGILTVHETERKNGSQSSNLYVFNRFSSIEPPKPEKLNHPETSSPLKQKNQNLSKRPEPVELDSTFTNDRVPPAFIQLVQSFFPSAKTIEKYWRMARIAAYRNNKENEPDTILETAIHAFKQLIGKLKSNRFIRNPFSYFYGILENKFMELYYEELQELEVESYDWGIAVESSPLCGVLGHRLQKNEAAICLVGGQYWNNRFKNRESEPKRSCLPVTETSTSYKSMEGEVVFVSIIYRQAFGLMFKLTYIRHYTDKSKVKGGRPWTNAMPVILMKSVTIQAEAGKLLVKAW